MGWLVRLIRWWRAGAHRRRQERMALTRMGLERERLVAELGRAVRHSTSDAEATEQQKNEYERLQRLDALYGELRRARAQRTGFLVLVAVVLIGFLLMLVREPETAFQLKGRFGSVLFRTTTDLFIEPGDHSAQWIREASLVMTDTTWGHKTGTPFPGRTPMNLVSRGNGPVAMSHLLLPAGTLVRLEQEGNLWSLCLEPKVEHRNAMSISLAGQGGPLVSDDDSLVTFAGGVELVPANAPMQLLQMMDLRLDLPCLSVDSVSFLTSRMLNADARPRTSTLDAQLTFGNVDRTTITLLQHDTLGIRLDGTASLCLTANETGLHVTQTGSALTLIAGRAGQDPGSLDRRERWLTARIRALSTDWLIFLLSIVVSGFGYFVLGRRS